MHVTIFNGSPRVRMHSNTDKIIQSFAKGLTSAGADYSLYTLSDRAQWSAAREAFAGSDRIIIALPLYVECVPGLLLEFLETLPKKRQEPAKISFILQGGFAEGCQLRCGEAFLKALPEQLGCLFGGTLVKGDNFGIRVLEGKERERILKPYEQMGFLYAENGDFFFDQAAKFTGPEIFPAPVRILISTLFKLKARKLYTGIASKWGCTTSLTDRPYE